MPKPDPVPTRQIANTHAWARYRRMMTWMAGLALLCVIAALGYFRAAGVPITLPLLIATMVGIFMTVMVGTGLMLLAFLSHGSGHDEAAADPFDERRE